MAHHALKLGEQLLFARRGFLLLLKIDGFGGGDVRLPVHVVLRQLPRLHKHGADSLEILAAVVGQK